MSNMVDSGEGLTEIYIAPVLGAMSRHSGLPNNETGQWPAVNGPLWKAAVAASARRRAARKAEAAGKTPRVFQRLSRHVSVEAGVSYTVRTSVRNNHEFPLGESVFGLIEVMWLDRKACELGRVSSRRIDRDLSASRWTGLAIFNAKAPQGAVAAIVCLSLYDEGRQGGSIWVRGLSMDVGISQREAGRGVPHGMLSA